MEYELFDYVLYTLLAYIVWVLITKYMNGNFRSTRENGVNEDANRGGAEDGDEETEGRVIRSGEDEGGSGEIKVAGNGSGEIGVGGNHDGSVDDGEYIGEFDDGEKGGDCAGDTDENDEGTGNNGAGEIGRDFGDPERSDEPGERDNTGTGRVDDSNDYFGPISRNLLKNNCGQEYLNDWFMTSNVRCWTVENIPVQADPLPIKGRDGNPIADFGGHTSCFTTQGQFCGKRQIIDLIAEGFTEEELRLRPPIEISEWYTCRPGCRGIYYLYAEILNSDQRPICDFQHTDNFVKTPQRIWTKASRVCADYLGTARYVSFHHLGNFHVKMSGGVVRVLRKV